VHDLVQRVLHPHLPEPELPEFTESLVHILEGDVHVLASSFEKPGQGLTADRSTTAGQK
jgi:hypothetical protein